MGELKLVAGIVIGENIHEIYEDEDGMVEIIQKTSNRYGMQVVEEDPWSGEALLVPGEQPLPKEGKTAVFDEVLKDLEARKQKGISTYGQALMTQNGRNALLDLYEELLDAVVYLKQAMLEREGR